MSTTFRRVAVALLLMAAVSSQAATYRCTSGGSSYFSDRPCTADPGRTQLGTYGPVRSAPALPYSSPLPAAPKAQEHTKYLSSGCASILEAIRTGPARGVHGDVISGLHEEYNQKCALEDQDARAQLQQEQTRQLQAKLSGRETERRERQDARRQADQCANMRDVIALKRKRESALNAAEVTALRDLEKAYDGRCLGR